MIYNKKQLGLSFQKNDTKVENDHNAHSCSRRRPLQLYRFQKRLVLYATLVQEMNHQIGSSYGFS